MGSRTAPIWSTYYGLRNCYALYDYLVTICPTAESVLAGVFDRLDIPWRPGFADLSVEHLVIHAIEECRSRGDIDSLLRLAIQISPFSPHHAAQKDRRIGALQRLQFERGQAKVAVVLSRGLSEARAIATELLAEVVPPIAKQTSLSEYCRALDQIMSTAWACVAVFDRETAKGKSQDRAYLEAAIHHAILRGLYVHVLMPKSREGREWVQRALQPARTRSAKASRLRRVTEYNATSGCQDSLDKLLTVELPRRAGTIESYAENVEHVCGCGRGPADEPFWMAHLSDLHLAQMPTPRACGVLCATTFWGRGSSAK